MSHVERPEAQDPQHDPGNKQHEPHQVTVTVNAPRELESKVFTWSRDLSVRAAALEAAQAFGYQGGDPTLGRGNEIFSRDSTLKDNHVHNNDKLELLDVAGGV